MFPLLNDGKIFSRTWGAVMASMRPFSSRISQPPFYFQKYPYPFSSLLFFSLFRITVIADTDNRNIIVLRIAGAEFFNSLQHLPDTTVCVRPGRQAMKQGKEPCLAIKSICLAFRFRNAVGEHQNALTFCICRRHVSNPPCFLIPSGFPGVSGMISHRPSGPVKIGGTWPALLYVSSPVRTFRMARKTVMNMSMLLPSASSVLAFCRISPGSIRSPWAALLRSALLRAINSAAGTPLSDTSPTMKQKRS